MRRSPLALLLILFLLLALPVMAAEAEPAAEGGTSRLIFKWLNFALVFGGLGYLLRKPIQRFFAGQRAAIRGAIEEAHEARQRSQQRLEEVEQRMARLEHEVEAMRKQAADNAAAERQRIHQAAEREAERILSTTRAEIESATRAARLELRAYTARLAVNLAEQRIPPQLTPEKHAALFQIFIRDFSPPGDSAPPPPGSGTAGRNRRQ
ncbi:MAG: ATP synthase F0 subunit B [Terriglobia bacterium]